MQLFNGLNMGMIKFYRLDFETPETGNGKPEEVDYSEKLNTINQKINELKNEDQNTENDAAANAAKETLNKLINTEFLNGFIKSLNEDQKNSLKGTLKQLLYAHKNEENFKTEYKGLINLATALGVNLEGGTETSEQPTEPKLELSGTLSGIEGPKKKEDGSYEEGEKKLYSQLTREASQEGQNIPDDKNFYKTSENAKTQLESVRGLLKNEKLKNNESLKGLEDNLVAIQAVIDNTTPENVKILQKFISENLDEGSQEKKVFDNASKKGENFDGKFGVGTLTGLNKVLKKTGEYINSFKNQPSESADDELLKDVKVKKSIDLPNGDGNINVNDLFEKLPENANAEFNGGKGINKGETKPQEVTVVVKDQNNKELGEITIIATVDTTNKKVGLKIKENGNPTTPTAPETPTPTETPITPTKPLEITINGQAEEHPVVTSDVTKKINTPLYYVNTGDEAASDKVDENGDREYLMQVNNETYKVKLDQNGNLKPLAINYESGAKLLLKNNPSCIAYLQSKIPANLPGNPRIARNPNMEDYVIRSTTDRGVKGLTIEPMTLDGKWLVGSNLGNNLALLNFTNFLRGNKNIDNLKFKNDNPDLKLDNGKLYVRIKKGTRLDNDSKSGKWYEVNLSKFGISQNALEDFIKYNNSEDWNDNWDKKKDNKGYTKIDFPNVSGPAETPTTTTPTETPTTTTPTETPTTTTPTEITTPAPTTQNTDIFPNVPNLSKEEKIKLREILSNPLELGNFVGGKFVFKEWLEKTDNTNKKYIEITVNNKNVKINEWQENISELGYKSGVKDNLGYLYMGEFKNGNMEGQGTYTWANGNKFDGEYETNNIKKGKFTLATPQEIKGEYDVEKDDKGLKIISEKNKGKYINTKTWGIEDGQEQPTDDQFSLTISDENLTKIGNDLGENMFIKKIEGGDVSYDLEKAKKYLNSCRGKARNLLQSNVAYIAAVQILLNDKADDNSKKVNISGKFDDETKNRVEEFQKNYNENLPTGATELIPDGKPGKNTLTVLLDGKIIITPTPHQADPSRMASTQESEITLSKLSKLGSFNILKLGNFDNNGFNFKPGLENSDSKGKFIKINGEKIYELGNNKNGIYYEIFKTDYNEYCFFFGQYKNGVSEGWGSSTDASGNKYVGYYKNNLKNGLGCNINNIGRYDGTFKNGYMEGQGTYTFKNGDNYKGEFKNGKMGGEGTYTFKNGDKIVGTWKNNKIWDGEKQIYRAPGTYTIGKKRRNGREYK